MSTPWQCGICRAGFDSKDDVALHLRRVHSQIGVPLVRVDATTWDKDKHHLFDAEATAHHTRQVLLVPTPSDPSAPVRFIRDKTGNVAVTLKQGKIESGEKSLHVQLKREHGLLAVEQTPKSSRKSADEVSSGDMWRCVDARGCPLQAGDVVRIGTLRVTVVQVCIDGDPRFPNLAAADDDDPIPVSCVSHSSLSLECVERTSSSSRCRICLGDAEDEGADAEPLIQAPCLCKGSNGKVHISCLRVWLSTRYGLTDKEGDGQYLSFRPPCCEICKTEFPVMVSLRKGPEAEVTPLLTEVPKIASPFIVLSIPRSKDKVDSSRPFGERFIFVPTKPDALLKLGRGSESQLRVKDNVSVSRVHTTISLVDGAFTLKDNDSKFQTLIRPTNAETLRNDQNPVKVQMGRTVLSFALADAMSVPELPTDDSAGFFTPTAFFTPPNGQSSDEVGASRCSAAARAPAAVLESSGQSVFTRLSGVAVRMCGGIVRI